MASQYTKRICIACPESMLNSEAANAIMAKIDEHLGGANEWPTANWQDVRGNKYAFLSFAARDSFNLNQGNPVIASNTAGKGAAKSNKILVCTDPIHKAPLESTRMMGLAVVVP